MKIAILQPYFFPYLGYWQLIHDVDRFVIYDDVNYIKRGWVNRNRILVNGQPVYITAPLIKASQNKLICDINLCPSLNWRNKMIKSIELAYRKSTWFNDVFLLIEKLIRYDVENLSDYLSYHLNALSKFLEIKTEFIFSSRCYRKEHLSGQKRIIDICKRLGATIYINPIGGITLYDPAAFLEAGIDLRFLSTQNIHYKQRGDGFVPWLSIIDVLMGIGPEGVKDHLNSYELVSIEGTNG